MCLSNRSIFDVFKGKDIFLQNSLTREIRMYGKNLWLKIRTEAGKMKSAQRQQLRQQIRMVVTSDAPHAQKDKELKSLR